MQPPAEAVLPGDWCSRRRRGSDIPAKETKLTVFPSQLTNHDIPLGVLDATLGDSCTGRGCALGCCAAPVAGALGSRKLEPQGALLLHQRPRQRLCGAGGHVIFWERWA